MTKRHDDRTTDRRKISSIGGGWVKKNSFLFLNILRNEFFFNQPNPDGILYLSREDPV
jgi:hypothetical protein